MSTYFTIGEMTCKDKKRTPYPAEWVKSRLADLFELGDEIRYNWGSALVVVSGYRTPSYNAALAKKSGGVAKDSQHVKGMAFDIQPVSPSKDRVEALWQLTRSLWHAGKLEKMGGLGVYPRWIHVDTRPHAPGQLVQWVGAGIGSEK